MTMLCIFPLLLLGSYTLCGSLFKSQALPPRYILRFGSVTGVLRIDALSNLVSCIPSFFPRFSQSNATKRTKPKLTTFACCRACVAKHPRACVSRRTCCNLQVQPRLLPVCRVADLCCRLGLTNSQVSPSASTHLNTHLSRLDSSESIAILQEAKAT